jgi:hypothetical protein
MQSESAMLARRGLDASEALVCTMVLVAAADSGITDREIGVMSGLVHEEDGLAHAGRLIRDALEPRLRETAYALACEVAAAADRHQRQSILQMLELVVSELHLDPLVAAAIERGTRARYQRI